MDIARLTNSKYSFETDSVAIMTISKDILAKVGVIAFDMRKSISNHAMYQASKDEYTKVLNRLGLIFSFLIWKEIFY